MPIIKDTELTGKRVITDDAADVGTVGDIYVDVYDWHITRFDLRVEKSYVERLGAEGRMLRKSIVPIRTHMVRAVGDVVHLKDGLEELKRSTKLVQPPTKEERPSHPKKEAVEEPKRATHTKRYEPEERPRKL
jgi:sporulation protein YlmC with PRC-barrel domain